jgi:hypothetical protein
MPPAPRFFCGRWSTGISKWSKEMGRIKKSITVFDPALSARDDEEEAPVGNLDHRGHGLEFASGFGAKRKERDPWT